MFVENTGLHLSRGLPIVRRKPASTNKKGWRNHGQPIEKEEATGARNS